MKISVDKHDAARVLLTEVLPYEVPYIFSNIPFYLRKKSIRRSGLKKETHPVLKYIVDGGGRFTIPYKYDASRGLGKTRELTVMHPSAQLSAVDLIDRFYSLMISACSKSQFSLRCISRVGSCYYEPELTPKIDKEFKEDSVDLAKSGYDKQTKYMLSYFHYSGYKRIHEFEESDEWLTLERDYAKLYVFDVSRCFYSIYSHSIEWAIKTRDFSKINIGKKTGVDDTFESRFDQWIRYANHGETSGIIVGPEMARVFAECIFQEIDCQIEAKLKEEGLCFGVDYELRRYVDNYFAFCRDSSVGLKIIDVARTELAKFKLFLNDNKTEEYDRPFVTDRALAKRELLKLLNDWMALIGLDGRLADKEYRDGAVNDRSLSGRRIVRDIRSIAKDYSLSVGDLSKLVLGVIRRRLLVFRKQVEKPIFRRSVDKGRLNSDFKVLVKVMLFILEDSRDARTVDQFSQCLVLIDETCNELKFKKILKKELHEQISEGFRAVFLERSKDCGLSNGNMEMLFLAIVIVEICGPFSIDSRFLIDVWGAEQSKVKDKDAGAFAYFPAICLMYLYHKRVGSVEIKRCILDTLNAQLAMRVSVRDASVVMACLDLISSPALEPVERRNIAEQLLKACKRVDSRVGGTVKGLIKEVCRSQWFVDWDAGLYMRQALFKKEQQSVY